MVKLTNKQHEQQQDRRIKKLENDLKQQKTMIKKLENRVKSDDVLTSKLKKEIEKLKKKMNDD